MSLIFSLPETTNDWNSLWILTSPSFNWSGWSTLWKFHKPVGSIPVSSDRQKYCTLYSWHLSHLRWSFLVSSNRWIIFSCMMMHFSPCLWADITLRLSWTIILPFDTLLSWKMQRPKYDNTGLCWRILSLRKLALLFASQSLCSRTCLIGLLQLS